MEKKASTYLTIAKRLNEDGIPSRFGKQWGQSVISKILSNYTYTGNLILQKTFRENHITKKTISAPSKKQPEVLHDWNDTIWTVMVEKAIVHRDGSITFRFYTNS